MAHETTMAIVCAYTITMVHACTIVIVLVSYRLGFMFHVSDFRAGGQGLRSEARQKSMCVGERQGPKRFTFKNIGSWSRASADGWIGGLSLRVIARQITPAKMPGTRLGDQARRFESHNEGRARRSSVKQWTGETTQLVDNRCFE